MKNSGYNMYDHSINMGNVNNSNQNPVFGGVGGGLFYNQGTGGPFSHSGTDTTSSFEEMRVNFHRKEVVKRGPFRKIPHSKVYTFAELGVNLRRDEADMRGPFQMSHNTAYSHSQGGVLQTDRSLLKTANNFNCLTEKSSNVYGSHKPQIAFIDLTKEDDIPQLVESNFIDLTGEKDTLVDNPIPQTKTRSLDDTQPSSEIIELDFDDTQPPPKRARLDFDDTQPPLKRARIDCQSDKPMERIDCQSDKRVRIDCQSDKPMELLQEHCQSDKPMERIDCQSDKPMELLQEHVQGPVCNSNRLVVSGKLRSCNSNHLVVSGELRSKVTSYVNKKSDLLQEGTKKHDEKASEENEKSTSKKKNLVTRNCVENLVSLIDSFSENQIKEHIASLNQSTSQTIGKRGEQKAEKSDFNTCQLCPMDKYMFNPSPVICVYCKSCVNPDTQFYWALDGDKKICVCNQCRNSKGTFISKSKLQKGKNEPETEEPWVQCDDCGLWQHQICALYNSLADTDGKEKYFCPYCLLKKRILGEPLPVAFGAKDLPSTSLSDHIEQRLFKQLDKDREDRAEKSGINVNEVPKAEDLVVRVVLSTKKQLGVNREFRSIISHDKYPKEFEYQSKMIMLFQKIEGVDVCLFAMYVQEYGSDCASPNQRSVYISYLDSVKYFKPEIKAATGEALRTYVYQEIMVGYLDYCKIQGFLTCYIWVCPPAKCDDFILYCHPKSQKMPSLEKLKHWYKAILKKSKKEGIVMNITNMYSQFFCSKEHTKITAARLPYFDGGFWSNEAENILKTIKKEKEAKSDKTATKRMARSMGYDDITDDNMMDILVMQKLTETFQHNTDNFLVVHLHDTCLTCNDVITENYWSCNQCKKQCKKADICSRCVNENGNLKEKKTHTNKYGEVHTLFQVAMNNLSDDSGRGEPRLDNDLFGDRDYLLSFCQENHYQFDTLRRAKYSSMMMLHNLKSQCVFKPSEKQQPQLSDQIIHEALIHASTCYTGCSNDVCSRLKKLFSHATTCSIKYAGGCKLCKKSFMLLQSHSRRCKDASCRVPRCKDFKERL